MKNDKNEETTGQDAIRKGMHRNGGEFPADVEDKTSPAADTKGRWNKVNQYKVPSRMHQDAADTVSETMRKKNISPDPIAPVRVDGEDVVDASGTDYREEVQLRPESVPRSAAGKPTRFTKKKRGESPGSYRQATNMDKYHASKGKGNTKSNKHKGKDTKSEKPEWAEYQTQCHAHRRDGKRCGNTSRKGSKFCHLTEHQPAKHGVPDYADDPAYSIKTDDQEDAKEFTGPLPEALRKPLLWVWGNFYTPFSWMVVWVFATAMSAKGKAGSAVLAPYHLMRYCVDSVACKWRWRQTVAILAQAMDRDKPLLGTSQVLQVLGSHRQIRNTKVKHDTALVQRISEGLASKGKNGKWKGRHGNTWAKTAAKFFDDFVNKRYEENLVMAFLDPNGPNSNCKGIEAFVKDDGTPDVKGARKKFKRSLTTINQLRQKKGVSPSFTDPKYNYEFCCHVSETIHVNLDGIGAKAYTKAEFIDAYVSRMRTSKTDIFDVFYLVDEDATCLRSGKKVADPVIIQVAVYSVEQNGRNVGKVFLGVGRKVKTGYAGPFESVFVRTSKRSPFEHVWDADDELDVMEVVAKDTPEAVRSRENLMIDALREGQVLDWDEIQSMLTA